MYSSKLLNLTSWTLFDQPCQVQVKPKSIVSMLSNQSPKGKWKGVDTIILPGLYEFLRLWAWDDTVWYMTYDDVNVDGTGSRSVICTFS